MMNAPFLSPRVKATAIEAETGPIVGFDPGIDIAEHSHGGDSFDPQIGREWG